MTADSAPQDARPHDRRSLWLLCALPLAFLAGCSGSSGSPLQTDVPSTSTLGPTPTSTSSSAADEQLILRTYAGVWGVLTPASRAPAARRLAMLAPYATNPALNSLLHGMAVEDSRGRVYYGKDRLRPRLRGISAAQGLAIIDDCQDSTASGAADRATLRPLTRGEARNHVVSTMHLVPNVGWRIAFITYPKTPC